MKKGQYVRLTKLAAVENPLAVTPDWQGFKPGQDNGDVSLPIDYTAEGFLAEDIKVGESLILNRTKRNGVTMPGLLTTSVLKGVDTTERSDTNRALRLSTQNSVYMIEQIPQN